MRPTTEDELSDAIRAARGPLVLRCGGTQPVGRPQPGEVLSMAGFTGITLYEPGALTLVARAGTPLAEVEAALEAEGQRLPFEPMDHRGLLGTADTPAAGGTGVPSIGGVVAANVSGPRRVQSGAARDSLIGVRFVDGAGRVIRNGGRVMKNVTGYDLVKLLAGSRGTLGALTELSFKVLPRPEAQATLALHGLDVAQSVAAMCAALRTPFEVNAAARDADGTVFLRIEGFADSVRYRTAQLQAHLAGHGAAVVLDADASAPTWAAIRDVAAFHAAPGDVWRVHCKPTDAPALVGRAGGRALLDWGGGLIWLLVAGGTDLRARLGGFDGHATLIRASEATRRAVQVFQPEPAPLAALSAGLRARFDPRGVLNPGLMA